MVGVAGFQIINIVTCRSLSLNNPYQPLSGPLSVCLIAWFKHYKTSSMLNWAVHQFCPVGRYQITSTFKFVPGQQR